MEKTKKRNRKILVCCNCHHKKKKCDRKLPCTSCVNLSIDDTCSYNTPSFKKQHLSEETNHTTSNILSETKSPHGTERDILPADSSIHERINTLNQRIRELEAALTVSALPNVRSYPEIQNEYKQNGVSHDFKQVVIKEPVNNELFGVENNSGFIGINPVTSSEHEINFLDNFHKSPNDEKKVPVTGFGPLRFLILLKQDPCGKLMISYLRSPSLKKFSYDPLGGSSQAESNDLQSINEKSREFYGESFIEKIGKQSTFSDILGVKKAISNFGLSFGMCFSSKQLTDNTNLTNQIQKIIPNRKIINELLNTFFEKLYPYFPIFDEPNFRSEIFQLIGKESERDEDLVTTINVKNKQDFAILASLLIILRLSYLSFFSVEVKNNEVLLDAEEKSPIMKNKKYQLLHPIPLETIYIAELCINEFGIASQPTLATLQAFLMLQVYRTYAPEEDVFAKNESAVSIGSLFHMANSLFLNRDPDYCQYFHENKLDDRTKALKRRLWYHLISIDFEDSVIYGTPILITESSYDTRVPFIPNGSATLSNLSLERQIVDFIEQFHPLIQGLRSILEKIFRVKSDIKISSLAELLSQFETLIQEKCGTLHDYLISNDHLRESFKIKKFKLYLQCKVMLSYIYYGFFLYYEHKVNILLSFFYMKKLLAIIFLELGAISKEFLQKYDKYFGLAFNLIVSPILQVFGRMELLLYQIQLRILCTRKSLDKILHEKKIDSKFLVNLYDKTLENIISLFTNLMEKNVRLIRHFADRYFFGWKMFKTHVYGLSVANDSFFFRDENATFDASFKYSLEEFYDLENLLSSCLKMKETYASYLQVPRTSPNNRDINESLKDDEAHATSDRRRMYELQVDKLWMLLEFFKQEGSGKFLVGKDKSDYAIDTANSLPEGSNTLANIEIDHMLPENILFGQFGADDFFDLYPFHHIS